MKIIFVCSLYFVFTLLFGHNKVDHLQEIYHDSLFSPQTLMNVRTQMLAVRSASTTKEIISVSAMKATRWTRPPRPAKLWVSYLHITKK